MPLAGGSGDLSIPSLATRPAKLDFAANPNHYPVNDNGKRKGKKLKPWQGPRVDRSARLELRLSVRCDVIQEADAEIEWWLSVMR